MQVAREEGSHLLLVQLEASPSNGEEERSFCNFAVVKITSSCLWTREMHVIATKLYLLSLKLWKEFIGIQVKQARFHHRCFSRRGKINSSSTLTWKNAPYASKYELKLNPNKTQLIFKNRSEDRVIIFIMIIIFFLDNNFTRNREKVFYMLEN